MTRRGTGVAAGAFDDVAPSLEPRELRAGAVQPIEDHARELGTLLDLIAWQSAACSYESSRFVAVRRTLDADVGVAPETGRAP